MEDSTLKARWREQITVFISSQTLSLFGSSLVQYAILWHITLETQSGFLVTLSIIFGFLPTFLLSPIAGVWADRYSRKRLIILSDIFIAITTLVLAVMMRFGVNAIWLLLALSFLRSIGTAIQLPAVNAVIPQIVPTEKLIRVGAINQTLQSVMMIITPLVSAALMSITALSNLLFIDVITAIPAVILLQFFLHVPFHRAEEEIATDDYISNLIKGFHYIRQHSFLSYFFLLYAVLFLLASPSAFLTPLQVTRSFDGTVWHLTAIELTFFIGMTLGGLLMTVWGGFKNRIHTMILAGFLLGISTFALGIVRIFWIYLGFMGLTGLSITILNTPAIVLLQEKVAESYMGRIFGVFNMIASSMMPLGMLIFGPLSDFIKIEWTLIATGILISILSLSVIKLKLLIEAGKPVTLTKSEYTS